MTITLKELKKSVDLKIKGRVSKPEKCSCGAEQKLADHKAWLEGEIRNGHLSVFEFLPEHSVKTIMHPMVIAGLQMALDNLNKTEEFICKCLCHKPAPKGWNSKQCCPDCGSSLIDVPKEIK